MVSKRRPSSTPKTRGASATHPESFDVELLRNLVNESVQQALLSARSPGSVSSETRDAQSNLELATPERPERGGRYEGRRSVGGNTDQGCGERALERSERCERDERATSVGARAKSVEGGVLVVSAENERVSELIRSHRDLSGDELNSDDDTPEADTVPSPPGRGRHPVSYSRREGLTSGQIGHSVDLIPTGEEAEKRLVNVTMMPVEKRTRRQNSATADDALDIDNLVYSEAEVVAWYLGPQVPSKASADRSRGSRGDLLDDEASDVDDTRAPRKQKRAPVWCCLCAKTFQNSTSHWNSHWETSAIRNRTKNAAIKHYSKCLREQFPNRENSFLELSRLQAIGREGHFNRQQLQALVDCLYDRFVYVVPFDLIAMTRRPQKYMVRSSDVSPIEEELTAGADGTPDVDDRLTYLGSLDLDKRNPGMWRTTVSMERTRSDVAARDIDELGLNRVLRIEDHPFLLRLQEKFQADAKHMPSKARYQRSQTTAWMNPLLKVLLVAMRLEGRFWVLRTVHDLPKFLYRSFHRIASLMETLFKTGSKSFSLAVRHAWAHIIFFVENVREWVHFESTKDRLTEYLDLHGKRSNRKMLHSSHANRRRNGDGQGSLSYRDVMKEVYKADRHILDVLTMMDQADDLREMVDSEGAKCWDQLSVLLAGRLVSQNGQRPELAHKLERSWFKESGDPETLHSIRTIRFPTNKTTCTNQYVCANKHMYDMMSAYDRHAEVLFPDRKYFFSTRSGARLFHVYEKYKTVWNDVTGGDFEWKFMEIRIAASSTQGNPFRQLDSLPDSFFSTTNLQGHGKKTAITRYLVGTEKLAQMGYEYLRKAELGEVSDEQFDTAVTRMIQDLDLDEIVATVERGVTATERQAAQSMLDALEGGDGTQLSRMTKRHQLGWRPLDGTALRTELERALNGMFDLPVGERKIDAVVFQGISERADRDVDLSDENRNAITRFFAAVECTNHMDRLISITSYLGWPMLIFIVDARMAVLEVRWLGYDASCSIDQCISVVLSSDLKKVYGDLSQAELQRAGRFKQVRKGKDDPLVTVRLGYPQEVASRVERKWIDSLMSDSTDASFVSSWVETLAKLAPMTFTNAVADEEVVDEDPMGDGEEIVDYDDDDDEEAEAIGEPARKVLRVDKSRDETQVHDDDHDVLMDGDQQVEETVPTEEESESLLFILERKAQRAIADLKESQEALVRKRRKRDQRSDGEGSVAAEKALSRAEEQLSKSEERALEARSTFATELAKWRTRAGFDHKSVYEQWEYAWGRLAEAPLHAEFPSNIATYFEGLEEPELRSSRPTTDVNDFMKFAAVEQYPWLEVVYQRPPHLQSLGPAVLAVVDIMKDSFLSTFRGVQIADRKTLKRYVRRVDSRRGLFQEMNVDGSISKYILENQVAVVGKKGRCSLGPLINHSVLHANCSLVEEQGVLLLKATRTIRAREEILLDFGEGRTKSSLCPCSICCGMCPCEKCGDEMVRPHETISFGTLPPLLFEYCTPEGLLRTRKEEFAECLAEILSNPAAEETPSRELQKEIESYLGMGLVDETKLVQTAKKLRKKLHSVHFDRRTVETLLDFSSLEALTIYQTRRFVNLLRLSRADHRIFRENVEKKSLNLQCLKVPSSEIAYGWLIQLLACGSSTISQLVRPTALSVPLSWSCEEMAKQVFDDSRPLFDI